MPEASIRGGELSATVSTRGVHGWCGLAELTHAAHPLDWLLRLALTLEHYLGVPLDSPDYIEYEPFESRRSLRSGPGDGCTLRYAPLNCCQADCTVRYQVAAPHYVDVMVTTRTERTSWPHDYLALFFATIVKAPIYAGVNLIGSDPTVSFNRTNPWIHFNGYGTTPGKTIHPLGVSEPELRRPSRAPDTYYYSDSSIRFELPFFFGLVDDMVFGVRFKARDRERVRFTVNPVAGAFGAPAWDFV